MHPVMYCIESVSQDWKKEFDYLIKLSLNFIFET